MEFGKFNRVKVLFVKLRSRLFVSVRISCLGGQSRHETRKIDVVSASFTAREDQSLAVSRVFIGLTTDYTTGTEDTSREGKMVSLLTLASCSLLH